MTTLKQRKVQIRTKNFSAKSLRGKVFFPVRSVVRLGSLTPTKEAFPISCKKGHEIVEVNTVDAVQNSRDKMLMKSCFDRNKKIQHASWKDEVDLNKDEFPVVVKRRLGFKGRGMHLIQNQQEYETWSKKASKKDYITEHFYNYSREYRLHCTQKECFLSWRKLRKKESQERWFFNSSNCNWVGEDHELFDKPVNWNKIIENCLLAMQEVGLDLGAVDVRVQSSKHKDPHFIICEVNSAPALGEVGVEIYRKQIIKILNDKQNG